MANPIISVKEHSTRAGLCKSESEYSIAAERIGSATACGTGGFRLRVTRSEILTSDQLHEVQRPVMLFIEL